MLFAVFIALTNSDGVASIQMPTELTFPDADAANRCAARIQDTIYKNSRAALINYSVFPCRIDGGPD